MTTYFDPARWQENAPGFSVGVSQNGKTRLLHHQGMANLEYGVPISDETMFHCASVSKQFVVFLCMDLAQKGKLDLDRPLQEFDPAFPDFGYTITPRHLVHHVSGLRDQWELFRMAGWTDADYKSMDQAYAMLLRQKKLNFEPETEYIYNNTGYTLLALLVEQVSEMSLQDYAKEIIFDPAGMKQSFIRMENRQVIPQRSYSYEMNQKGEYEKAFLSYSIYGATSLFSTVQDLLHWGEYFLSLRTENRELYDMMTEQFKLKNEEVIEYAGGLMVGNFLGYQTVKHGGWDAGYRASFIMIPEINAVTCCLSNHANFKPEGYAKYYLKEAIPELKNKDDEFLMELNNIRESYSGNHLQDPCGLYAPDIGSYFWIRRKGENLYITMPSMPELLLDEVPEGGYTIHGTEIFFYPMKDEKGQSVLYSVYPYDIQKSTLLPLEEQSEVNDYCGDYACPELESRYKIVVKDGVLHLEHVRMKAAKLIKVAGEKDVFVALPDRDSIQGQIDFVKDGDGRISGFYLSRPRAKYVSFEKLGE